jgi:urea carboxylase-associated protein 2
MAGTVVEAMPTIPAASWEQLPDGVARDALTWAEVVGGADYTSKVLARGTHVRLTDLAGDACAHVLLYNADQPFERLNVADTVKVPWQAYMGAGHPLLSDQGRVLATIVADDSGRHDALAGTSSRAANEARYGTGEAQSATPAGRELLLLAAMKHGLGPRDVAPSVSFFKGVRVLEDGSTEFTGSAGAGRSVMLRAELPLIVAVANVPHPLDPRKRYTCTNLEVVAWRGEPTAPLDPLWSSTPELERAFLNTADYAAARGL